jgi:hypothetical protein
VNGTPSCIQTFTSADITAKDKLEASIQSDDRRVFEEKVIAS